MEPQRTRNTDRVRTHLSDISPGGYARRRAPQRARRDTSPVWRVFAGQSVLAAVLLTALAGAVLLGGEGGDRAAAFLRDGLSENETLAAVSAQFEEAAARSVFLSGLFGLGEARLVSGENAETDGTAEPQDTPGAAEAETDADASTHTMTLALAADSETDRRAGLEADLSFARTLLPALGSGGVDGGGDVPDNVTAVAPWLPLRLQAPAAGTRTSLFGWRIHPITGEYSFHRGLDIAAAEGTPLGAAAAGVVRETGTNAGDGNYVWLSHGDGVETFYGHLSQISVSRGDALEAGGTIGKMGDTGLSTGPHVHFSVMVNGSFVDPEAYLPAEG